MFEARSQLGINENWENYLEQPNLKEVTQCLVEQKNKIKELTKTLQALQGRQVDVDSLIEQAHPLSSGKLVCVNLDIEDRRVLLDITDKIKSKIKSGIILIVGRGEKGNPVLITVSKDLSDKYRANEILKEVSAVLGGRGGGKT